METAELTGAALVRLQVPGRRRHATCSRPSRRRVRDRDPRGRVSPGDARAVPAGAAPTARTRSTEPDFVARARAPDGRRRRRRDRGRHASSSATPASRSGEVADVRPMGAEQSNSSLIVDDRIALKAYRRLGAGPNPELEVLRFLTERGFEHIPALRGWYAHTGRLIDATLGVAQEFVPESVDGWDLALEDLRDGAGALRRARPRAGRRHRAAAHRARVRRDRSGVRAGGDSAESLGLLNATVDEEIEQVFLHLPRGHARARADPRPRPGGARAPLAADDRRLGRTDHPPPRRLPPRPGAARRGARLGDPRLRGRAGAHARGAPPQALAAARRRRDAALVRVRRQRLADPLRGARSRGLGGRACAPRSSRATWAASTSVCCRPARPPSSG